MYNIIKSVIESTQYQVGDMIKKIDTIWIRGEIDDIQKSELINLAITNATRDEEIKVLLTRVIDRLDALEKIVDTLKNGGAITKPTVDEYPAWAPYDGIHANKYMINSKVTHNGEKYISMVDNNVWEPGGPGIDDRIWKKVVSA